MPRCLAVLLISLLSAGCTRAPAPDPTLVLRTDPTEITIGQRTSDPVPGSKGRIRLDIGDITAGQVLTRLAMEGEEDIIPRRSMSIGDTVEFTVDGSRLSLGLVQLVNRLVGDDHAVFLIGKPRSVVTGQIEHLLRQIEGSKLMFVQDGEDHEGRAMAGQLRRKWEMVADEIRTAREFIERIATKSSTTSQPYEVRAGRTTVPLAKWLRREP